MLAYLLRAPLARSRVFAFHLGQDTRIAGFDRPLGDESMTSLAFGSILGVICSMPQEQVPTIEGRWANLAAKRPHITWCVETKLVWVGVDDPSSTKRE